MTSQDKIDNLNVKFERIPHRTGRSKFEGCKDMIHWLVTINNLKPVEFSVGIGHYINTQHPLFNKVFFRPILKKFLKGEHIEWMGSGASFKELRALFIKDKVSKPLGGYLAQPPKIKDVLYSLSMDSEALMYDFKEWCDNMGCNTDSISDKQVFEACRSTGALLLQLGFNLEELQEYFQDY